MVSYNNYGSTEQRRNHYEETHFFLFLALVLLLAVFPARNAKSYKYVDANRKPLILNIPLTASGVKERNQMESFRMNFANVKNGKVTLDYIFIGPSELAPN